MGGFADRALGRNYVLLSLLGGIGGAGVYYIVHRGNYYSCL